MATTLTQLQAKVIHKLGLDASDHMLTEVTESINAGIQQMATEYDWPWLVRESTFPTVAGTTDYVTPTGWTRTRGLYDGSCALSSVQRRKVAELSDSPGLPCVYYIQNLSIKLGPTPDGVRTMTHEYVIAENTLSAGSDTVICPDFYTDIIVTYAALEEASRQKDSVLFGLLEKKRDQWINRLRDNIQRTADLPEISTRSDW